MPHRIDIFRRYISGILLLSLMTLLAACDPLVVTEEPVVIGAPMNAATGRALAGEYTVDPFGQPQRVSVSWQDTSGANGFSGHGAVRAKVYDADDGPLLYDLSAVLTRLPETAQVPGKVRYAASTLPNVSRAYDKPLPGGELPSAKFKMSAIAFIEISGTDISVLPWLASSSVAEATGMAWPPREKRELLESGETELVVITKQAVMSRMLVAAMMGGEQVEGLKLVKLGASAARPSPRSSEGKQCIPDVMLRSQAYSDNQAARERYAMWLADNAAACPNNCGEAVGWLASRSLNGSAAATARLRQWQRTNMCSVADGNNPVLRDYVTRAKAGDKDAMFNLGVLYGMDTAVVPLNVDQSVKWYLAGAAAGHTMSQYRAGQFYQYGIREPDGSRVYLAPSNAKARYWYDKAAAAGHAEAAAARRQLNSRAADRDPTAQDLLAAAGAIAVTYCILNPDDCFGERQAPAPAVSGAGSCPARIDAGLMRCKSLVDFMGCNSVGCPHYWECNREQRYIKNNKVKYYRQKYDVRSYGKCSRPGSSSRFDDWLYCDPETGKSAESYERMVAKACR